MLSTHPLAAARQRVAEIDSAELRRRVAAGARLIDVREPHEFAAGHAAGARNVPLGTLDGAKGLPTNKAVPLVVMCATGARASRAAAQLRKAGHASVHALAGGTAAWREASLPIEKSA